MNLLNIVQEFCQTTGLGKPQIVMASGDDQLLQIVGLANAVCRDLTRRKDWQALQFEALWTSTAGEDQGALTTLAPNCFKAFSAETIYDRSRQLPIFGPKTQAQWAQTKSMPYTGPFYQFRIRNGRLLITPAMEAGHTLAFEYNSKGCVFSTVNIATPYQVGFVADTDEFLLDESLLFAGLTYRWNRQKGFAFATEFQDYEAMIADVYGRDGAKPILSMNCAPTGVSPGIFIPAGSWSIP